MLTTTAKRALKSFIEYQCTLKLLPYEWDKQHNQFKHGNAKHERIFRIHSIVSLFMVGFSGFRFIQGIRKGYFPLGLKVLNGVFVIAYVLTFICIAQFHRKRDAIQEFSNALLKIIFRRQPEKLQEDEKSVSKGRNKSSRYLLFALLMLSGNPSVHLLLVDENPCTPHFISSLAFECKRYDTEGIEFIHKVPFMVIEYYLTTLMFTLWTFNWTILFLAMASACKELKKIIYVMKRTKMAPGMVHYRSVQIFITAMNDAFKFYLIAFPILLLAIVSVLFFGVIRIWATSRGTNIMFPLCAMQCFFESITPLQESANINHLSDQIVEKALELVVKENGKNKKLQKSILNSTQRIRCCAGSLYTFENMIVIIALNNCMQLTFHMLLTFG